MAGLFDDDEETAHDQGHQSRGLFGGLPAALDAATVVVKALPGTTLDSIPAPYQPLGDAELSDQEQQDLQTCKAGIDNLRTAFWIAGKALDTARSARLHREENPNFADWVWLNWEISESQQHRLMDEWRIGQALAAIGHKPLESQVRMLTDVRRQTSDEVAIRVYDTIARCVPRVTARIIGDVVKELGPLPKDLEVSEAGRRVRQVLAKDDRQDGEDATTHGHDSPIGESSASTAETGGDQDADGGTVRDQRPGQDKDVEHLKAVLASLRDAAKMVTKAGARRALEHDPDRAAPLIEAIGTTLQKIDRAIAVQLPKQG